MIAAIRLTKRCTKCGEEKDRGEFYVHRRLKNGGVIHSPKCKACARRIMANRKRRGDGEYRTLSVIQANKQPPKIHVDKWMKAAMRELNKLNKQEDDIWTKRIESARASLRLRSVSPRGRTGMS